jgi:signal peptidase I
MSSRNLKSTPARPNREKRGEPPTGGDKSAPPASWSWRARELSDELVFVFLIVAFMKLFLVDIYKIPTGSMTPTLLGGTVAETDVNGDGLEDLVYWDPHGGGQIMDSGLVFLNDGQLKRLAPSVRTSAMMNNPRTNPKMRNVYDKILVNKMVYWFRDPRRGEVAIFKVPPPQFRVEAPIYIKRLVGERGETLTFIPDPELGGKFAQLALDGTPVTDPPFFASWRYRSIVNLNSRDAVKLPYVAYREMPDGTQWLDRIEIPDDMVYMFGDNTESSLDSRYWGGVPVENLKGRAFLRVWPLRRIGWIE